MIQKTLERVRGGRIWVLLGAGLLLYAAASPWFRVPHHWEDGGESLVLLASRAEAPYQLTVGLLGLVFLGAWFFLLTGRRGTGLLGLVGLVTVGLFPAAAVVHDPAASAIAVWFDQAHTSLVWLGGDIALSQGASETLLEEDVLVSDHPVTFRALPSPQDLRSTTGMGVIHEATQWLGYSNPFVAFVRRGWVLSLLGLGLVLVGWVTSSPKPLRALALGTGSLGVLQVFGLVVGLAPVYMASKDLDTAEEATRHGRYREAMASLERAGHRVPLFAWDTHYIAQHGLLSVRLGERELPSARLYLARTTRIHVEDTSTRSVLRDLATDPLTPDPVRREAARALAREGCQALNTGMTTEALAQLDVAALVLPTDPKLEFARQLAWLRLGEVDELTRSMERTLRLYRSVNLPSSAAVVSVSLERLARAQFARGNMRQAADHASMRGVIR